MAGHKTNKSLTDMIAKEDLRGLFRSYLVFAALEILIFSLFFFRVDIYLVLTGAVATGIVGIGIFYLFLRYRIQEKQIEHDHRYRVELTARTGKILLDDGTVIDTPETEKRIVSAG